MVRLATLADVEYIKRIANTPGIWQSISDDETHGFEPEKWLCIPGIYILICDIGFMICHMQNSRMTQGHFAFIVGGDKAKKATEEGIQWVFDNTQFTKMIGMIPSFNRPAQMMACAAGMHREGLIKKAFLKDGLMHDLIIYGKEK